MNTGAFNIAVVREYEKQGVSGRQWLTIGKAFPNKKGGFTIHLNALPIPDSKGQVTMGMFPDKDMPKITNQASLSSPTGNKPPELGPLGEDPPTPTQAPPEPEETENTRPAQTDDIPF